MQIKPFALRAVAAALLIGGLLQSGVAAPAPAESAMPSARAAKSMAAVVPIFSQSVVFTLPGGWKPAFENDGKDSYMLEFVPQGQTVEAWKEMITVQGLRNLAKNPQFAPLALIENIAGGLKKICGDELIFQSLGDTKVGVYDAHAAILGCARVEVEAFGAKTGQGELAYYLVIKGTNDMYVVQRAIRGAAFAKADAPISPGSAEAFMRAMQPIKVCERSGSQVDCAAQASR